jgi:hypothetical protein
MSNEVLKLHQTPEQAIMPWEKEAASNPLEQFVAENDFSPFVGRILRFNKGDWLTKNDLGFDQEVDTNSEFVVAIDSLESGWVKWEDKQPVERRMGLAIEGFRMPARSALDDNDPTLWPFDERKQTRSDPWQRTYTVVLFDSSKGADDETGLYTFVTSSTGGRKAITELCKQVVKHPNENPMIKLETGGFKSKKHGLIKQPILKVVGWVQK